MSTFLIQKRPFREESCGHDLESGKIFVGKKKDI
jgi:hypothetical protein